MALDYRYVNTTGPSRKKAKRLVAGKQKRLKKGKTQFQLHVMELMGALK